MEENVDQAVPMGLQDFRHPRFRDVEARLYEIAAENGSPNARILLVYNQFERGRPAAAREILDGPGFPALPRFGYLYWAWSHGFPVTDEEVDAASRIDPADLPADDFRAIYWFFQGAYAADRGRESERAAARGALRDLAARLRVEGDSTNARFADGAGLALDGLLAWKRGSLEVAEEFLEEARVTATGHGAKWRVNDTIRWWIGDVLVEQGRLHEAEPYFTSQSMSPFAYRRLGEIWQSAGEPEKAREAYELFLTAWRDAEPEMAPAVARVRQALAGVAPLRRE